QPSRRSPPPRLHAGSTLIDPCRVDLSVTLQVEAPPPRPAPPPSRAGGHDGPPNAVARHGAHIGAGIGQPLQGVGSAAEEVEERSRLRDRAPHDADRLAARTGFRLLEDGTRRRMERTGTGWGWFQGDLTGPVAEMDPNNRASHSMLFIRRLRARGNPRSGALHRFVRPGQMATGAGRTPAPRCRGRRRT